MAFKKRNNIFLVINIFEINFFWWQWTKWPIAETDQKVI